MRLPESFYNPISLVGSFIASLNAVLIVTFSIAFSIFGTGSTYIGLFVYIVLPALLIFGLIMIPIGMLRRNRRIKKGDSKLIRKGLLIDFNSRKHRNALGIFIIGSLFLLFLTGIGSYEAFHITESNEFCGLLCHKVMKPEYVAYEGSEHSRVACVECHVGSGANWYVKSKLSGLYQVYSVLSDKYPRPITTPVHNLRPARETCEKCHWPNKFYSYRIQNEKHYLADENNTEWTIQLKMKTGSEHSSMGLNEGIHWHINPEIKIEYISSSDKREIIPWVRSINIATGDTIIYNDLYNQIDEIALDTLEIRVMDCIDCHNRPSHDYLPPQEFIDLLIASGDIPVSLPGIKGLSMNLLTPMYETYDTAMLLIEAGVLDFYKTSYPEIANNSSDQINQAIAGIKEGFSKNIFPEMKVSWDSYPNQIGHVEFMGCFRCHNGDHLDESANVISRDCDICHSIILQGTNDDLQIAAANGSLEFRHPVDIGEVWKEYSCTECHRHLY